MDPAFLASALKARKKYVEESSDAVVVGLGTNGDLRPTSNTTVFGIESFTSKSPTGFTGLLNQGATCYLNSLVQSLFMLPDFRSVLYSWDYNPSVHGSEELCLTRQLQRLFAQLQLSARGAVSTAPLTRSFGWSGSESFVQHDVQECMTVMFDFIASQCCDSELGYFINEHMMGRSYNELTCQNCQRTRRRPEFFRDIQLQVRGFSNFRDSLEDYLKAETLSGVECDSAVCLSGRYDHYSRVTLDRLPHLLIVQLRRFDLNYETMQREYLSNSEGADIDSSEFDLMSILGHTGSAYAGHYYAYIKDESFSPDGTSRSSWLLFNDSTITRLDEAEINAILDRSGEATPDTAPELGQATPVASSPSGVKCPSNAYMLIYRKRSESNLVSVADEMVPKILARAIEKDNEMYMELKDKRDYEKSFMQLQVSHGSIMKLLRVHESTTVKQFTDIAYQAVRDEVMSRRAVPLEQEQQVPLERDSEGILNSTREVVRLRAFDSIKQRFLPPSEFGGSTLPELKVFSNHVLSKVFRFEILSFPNVVFEPIESTSPSIEVLVTCYSSANESFSRPFPVLVTETMCVDTFCGYVSMVATNLGSCNSCSTIAVVDESTNNVQVLAALKAEAAVGEVLQHGSIVYVELFDDSGRGGCSLVQYFQRKNPSITLHFSMPTLRNGDSSHVIRLKAGPFDTLETVKQQVSELVGVASSSFSMHVGRRALYKKVGEYHFEDGVIVENSSKDAAEGVFDVGPGEEAKDLAQTVGAAGLKDGSELELVWGAALGPKDIRVNVFLDVSSIEGAKNNCISEDERFIFIIDLVVCSSDSVAAVKDKVLQQLPSQYQQGNMRMRTGELLKAPVFPNSPLKPNVAIANSTLLRSYSMDDLGYQVKATNKILVDKSNINQEIKTLKDGYCLVCQMNVPEHEFLSDSVLVSVQFWSIDRMSLVKLGEAVISKDITVRELKDQLRRLHRNAVVHGELAECINENDKISVVKPFSWQMHDISNMQDLKWSVQPSETALVTAPPLRLNSGCIVLFAGTAELESQELERRRREAVGDLDNGDETKGGDGIKRRPQDRAFRIMSVAEQIAARNES